MENGEFRISAINIRNEPIEVLIHSCPHCSEAIPKIGECPECMTQFVHMDTFEDFKTGFIHYIYECNGCPPDRRKARKVIKATGIIDESRLSIKKDLADSFLKSGGY
ncbi:MAG TPA: hypothetical protein HA257_05525 [Candidatus Methanoperedenaceae archaeon]|nr:hypothetical protein [Candidatus Methanoperedenaceae archaeon]